MYIRARSIGCRVAVLWVAGGLVAVGWAQQPPRQPPSSDKARAEPAAVKEFVAKFRETFKSDPDVHAALAYDGIRLLAAAMKNALANTTTLPVELRALKDFAGLTGPFSFSADQTARRPAYVLRCDGERASLEQRYEP